MPCSVRFSTTPASSSIAPNAAPLRQPSPHALRQDGRTARFRELNARNLARWNALAEDDRLRSASCSPPLSDPTHSRRRNDRGAWPPPPAIATDRHGRCPLHLASTLDGRQTRTPHLDALRIVAAAAVVVLHYAEYTKDNAAAHFIFAHVQHFNLFVDLFFVISGFVIARQYLEKVDTAFGVKRFLWRRIARIYPLHLLTLGFYLAIAAALQLGLARGENPARYPLSDIPAQLLMLHAVVGERLTFNFPSWSLSAEMVCYLLFPMLAAVAARQRDPDRHPGAGRAGGQQPLRGRDQHGSVDRVDQSRRRLSRAAELRVWALRSTSSARRSAGGRRSSCRSCPCCWHSCCSAAHFRTGSYLPRSTPSWCSPFVPTSPQQRTLLSQSGIDRWSDLTYSVYMLHIPVATVVLTIAGRYMSAFVPDARLMLVPVAMAVLALASHLSYRYVETPIRHFLYALFDRRSEPRPRLADSRSQGAKADERVHHRGRLSVARPDAGQPPRTARSGDRQPSRRRDPDGDRHPFAASAAGYRAGAGCRCRLAARGGAVPVRLRIPDRTHAARSDRKASQGGSRSPTPSRSLQPISTWPCTIRRWTIVPGSLLRASASATSSSTTMCPSISAARWRSG